VTKPSPQNPAVDLREAGRKGGIASGEARRNRRDRDVGIVAWDVLHANPEPVIRRVYESGNAVAIVDMIRFATETKTAQLRTRERELEQRERELTRRASEVSQRESRMESWPEWVAETDAEAARIEAEVQALERQRDELRLEIAREADAHDFELVED